MNIDDGIYKGAKYGSKGAKSGISVPEIETTGFDWQVKYGVTTEKRTSGFLVDPQVECMIDLGNERNVSTTSSRKDAIISGMIIDLSTFISEDGVDEIKVLSSCKESY